MSKLLQLLSPVCNSKSGKDDCATPALHQHAVLARQQPSHKFAASTKLKTFMCVSGFAASADLKQSMC